MHFHHWFRERFRHGDHGFHVIGRGRARHFGGDDEGFGGPFSGRHGGGRLGRMFGHGDLKLILLALIAEQPRHGYQLIRTIEEMFGGSYAPSPGAVYPTLTMLEEMGYASVELEGGTRKLYSVTDEGRAFLDENRDTVEALMARMEVTARAASRWNAPMQIHEAMRTLMHALKLHGSAWSDAEARRVRAIIEKAAAEISKS